jgi:hypothetical protein
MLTPWRAIQLYFRANWVAVVVMQREIRFAALKMSLPPTLLHTEGSKPSQPQNTLKIDVLYGENTVSTSSMLINVD